MRLFSKTILNFSAPLITFIIGLVDRAFAVGAQSDRYTVLLDNLDALQNHDKMSQTSEDNLSFEILTRGNYSDSAGNMSANVSVQTQGLIMTPQHYVLIVLYTMTTMLAISGNSLAIVIFTKGKRSKTDLRPFLINLAIADLIMAIFCIPFTFTYQLLDSNWIFSRPMCPIMMFLQIVSVTGSVSTNIAIGIDRFWGIAFPLTASRTNPLRYRLIILVIWIISIAFGSVQLYVGGTKYVPEENRIECGENWSSPTLALVYTVLVLVMTYLVPVIVLTATYSIVGYLLWKRNVPGNADAQRDQSQLKSKVKIVKMLVTIVVLFVLCWLPLHIFFLIIYFTDDVDHKSPPIILTYFICHWVAMSNSFVNPIVYISLNDSFRADVKSLLFRCFRTDLKNNPSHRRAVKFKYRSDKYIVNHTSQGNSHLSLPPGTPCLHHSSFTRGSSPTASTRGNSY